MIISLVLTGQFLLSACKFADLENGRRRMCSAISHRDRRLTWEGGVKVMVIPRGFSINVTIANIKLVICVSLRTEQNYCCKHAWELLKSPVCTLPFWIFLSVFHRVHLNIRYAYDMINSRVKSQPPFLFSFWVLIYAFLILMHQSTICPREGGRYSISPMYSWVCPIPPPLVKPLTGS